MVGRYFFDISGVEQYLRHSTHYTGIQRVVVMLITRTAELVGKENVFLATSEQGIGDIYALPMSVVEHDGLLEPSSFSKVLNGDGSARDLAPISRYRSRPLKYYFHRTVLDIAARIGWKTRLAKFGVDADFWRLLRKHQPKPTEPAHRYPMSSFAEPDDILFMIDGSWNIDKDITVAKAKGLKIVTMIYDLIPILAPEMVPQNFPEGFEKWLKESTGYTSMYLSISDHSKKDMDQYLKSNGLEIPVCSLPLAQESVSQRTGLPAIFDSSDADRTAKSGDVPRLDIGQRILELVSHPYVLFVGTLETRKNTYRMARVWDRLRKVKSAEIPKLVLVGRPGWHNSEFDAFMKKNKKLRDWILIVESPRDEELDYLYRNCEFAIQVSLFEGWGLPVGEALSYGKTSVVANSTSLPEVGGDLVEYCDPKSIRSIELACLKLINDVEYRRSLEKKIQGATLRSWKDVAKDMIRYIG